MTCDGAWEPLWSLLMPNIRTITAEMPRYPMSFTLRHVQPGVGIRSKPWGLSFRDEVDKQYTGELTRVGKVFMCRGLEAGNSRRAITRAMRAITRAMCMRSCCQTEA